MKNDKTLKPRAISEKEKMLSGELYNTADAELLRERERAKELCYDYNQLRPGDEVGRKTVLDKLLGRTGENCAILAPFWCDYGYNIRAGEGFFANHGLVILDCAPVEFGANVIVGPNCGFYTAEHPIEDLNARNAGIESARSITVGDNVWFGGGVHVMPGVKIGSNVVIGGGSIVVHDLPDNCVDVGNSCRPIRQLVKKPMSRASSEPRKRIYKHDIICKRVYDEPDDADGERILVDRLWPRGVRIDKAALTQWAKDAAPSKELREWFAHQPERFAEFREKYLAELNSSPEAANLSVSCAKWLKSAPVTLLYAAKNAERNNAVVLREWLLNSLHARNR